MGLRGRLVRRALRAELTAARRAPEVGLARTFGWLGLAGTVAGVVTWPLAASTGGDEFRFAVLAAEFVVSLLYVLLPARRLTFPVAYLAVWSALVLQTGYVAVTGGLASPYRPGFAPIVLAASLFASQRMTAVTVVAAIVGLAVACLGDRGPSGPVVTTILTTGSALVAIGATTALLATANRRRVQRMELRLSAARRRAALGRAEALLDPLTGLYNRRAFERDLARAFLGRPRAGSVMLAMIDTDGLKRVNDRYGHPAGDATLRALASAVRATVRSDDRVYRIGGDEFAVLAGSADPRGLSDRLARHVEASVPGVGPVRASIGVATNAAGDTASVLLERADRTLYAVKHGIAILPAASV